MSQRKRDLFMLPKKLLKFKFYQLLVSKVQRRFPFEEAAARLPIEIVENIFVQAACDPSLRSWSLDLTRVSKYVNKLVCPYIYYTVQLKRESQAESFLFTITHHPELCRYIVNFEVPEVMTPFDPTCISREVQEQPEIWIHSWSNESPNLDTLVQISRILLESVVNQSANETKTENPSSPPAIASRLQSVTINSLCFASLQYYYSKLGPAGLGKLVFPPALTITSYNQFRITGGPSVWDYTRVKKLRFTSRSMDVGSYITELLSLPKLTHLALPLGMVITSSVRLLLSSPRIRKLAVFTEYGPNSTVIPRRICRPSHRIDIPESLWVNIHGRELSNRMWADSEGLGSIVDNRLFLFDYTEMERVYEMSNEEFWDVIDQL